MTLHIPLTFNPWDIALGVLLGWALLALGAGLLGWLGIGND